MRKLMRSVARANMEAQGITGYNKKRLRKGAKGQWLGSYFAETWRQYATQKAQKTALNERIRRAKKA